MERDAIQTTLESIAQDVVERAQLELGAYRTVNGKKRRAVATGLLKNSLTYRSTTRYNNPIIDFGASGKAGDYLKYVTFGRKKGARMPPLKPILDWMRIKRLRPRNKNGGFIKATDGNLRSMAWNIARSISKKGIEPFPFYANAIEDVMAKRGREFEEAIKKEIEFRLKLK